MMMTKNRNYLLKLKRTKLLNLLFSLYLVIGGMSLFVLTSSEGVIQLPFTIWVFLGLAVSLITTFRGNSSNPFRAELSFRFLSALTFTILVTTLFLEPYLPSGESLWKMDILILLISFILMVRTVFHTIDTLSSYLNELMLSELRRFRWASEPKNPLKLAESVAQKFAELMGFSAVEVIQEVPIAQNNPVLVFWEGHVVYYIPFIYKSIYNSKSGDPNEGEVRRGSVVFIDYPGMLPTMTQMHLIKDFHRELQHILSAYVISEEKRVMEDILFQESLLASQTHLLKNMVSAIVQAINTGDQSIIKEAAREGMETISSLKSSLEILRGIPKREKIDLGEFVKTALPRVTRDTLKIVKPKHISFSSHALKLVLDDLIKNSLRSNARYSEKPLIVVEENTLRIKNRASFEDYQKVKRALEGRFVRSGKGFGMGLSMIFRILRRSNAEYQVKFENDYLEIIIKFPLWKEESTPNPKIKKKNPFRSRESSDLA